LKKVPEKKFDKKAYDRAKALIKQDGIYNFGLGSEIIVLSPPDDLTLKIARVLSDAAAIRESSFDKKAADKAERKQRFVDFKDFYTKTLAESAYEACNKNSINGNLWYLVYIALQTGWNDVLSWSQEMRKKVA
jgi:hypothetical protein